MKKLHVLALLMLVRGISSSMDADMLGQFQRGFVKCLTIIINRHFEPGPLQISIPTFGIKITQNLGRYLSQNNELVLVNILLKCINENHLPIHITNPETSSPMTISYNDYVKRNSYIIFLWTSSEDVIDVFEELQYESSWNPRARFLIVTFIDGLQTNQSTISSIFEDIWNDYSISEVVILTCTDLRNKHSPNVEEDSLAIELYTWFPYKSNNCGRVIQIELLDRWILSEDNFFRDLTIYPNKIPHNFRGCQITVSTYEVPMQVELLDKYMNNNKTVNVLSGLEILFLLYIQEATNISIEYLLHKGDNHFQSHFDMVAEVSVGKADVTASFFPLHPAVTDIVDPTISYESNYLRWYVPCGRAIPRMDKIVNIFTLSVWIVMGITTLSVVVIVQWLGKTTNRESTNYRTYTSIYYNLISVTFGVSVPQLPRTSKIRFIFSMWMWYCLVISTIFQVFFTSFLVDPGTHKPITSLNELLKSKLKYAFNHGWDEYVRATSFEYYSKINLDKVPCEDFNCFELVLNSTNFLTVSSSSMFEYYIITSLHGYNMHICTIPEDIFRIDIVMYLRKGSPLLSSFNSAIRRMLEFGFVIKYQRDMVFILRNEKDSTKNENVETSVIEYFVFSMDHLMFSFYFLGIGYVLSLVLFLIELLYQYADNVAFLHNK